MKLCSLGELFSLLAVFFFSFSLYAHKKHSMWTFVIKMHGRFYSAGLPPIADCISGGGVVGAGHCQS